MSGFDPTIQAIRVLPAGCLRYWTGAEAAGRSGYLRKNSAQEALAVGVREEARRGSSHVCTDGVPGFRASVPESMPVLTDGE